MDVVAFVGPSGTGKSHRALVVAHDCGADAIIDDGLLIQGTKIVAGYSAKNEPNKIQAVKRAIFSEQKHVDEVATAISVHQPKRILILGTSVNMVSRIAERLRLPKPCKVIQIEDIASVREIAKARESRLKDGRHIVPVPTIELKPHFSGYLIDPLVDLFNRPKSKLRHLGEKSIVRPAFSYYGKLLIADSAIEAIVRHAATAFETVRKVSAVRIRRMDDKDRAIVIALDVTLLYGVQIRELIRQVQDSVKADVEFMTAMTVKTVNVEVKKLTID